MKSHAQLRKDQRGWVGGGGGWSMDTDHSSNTLRGRVMIEIGIITDVAVVR